MKRFLIPMLCVAILLAGCGSSTAPQTDAGGPTEGMEGDYFIGGGSSGGTYYAMSTTFAQFFNDIGGLGQFTPYTTTGTGQNLQFMKNKEIEFGVINGPVGVDALNGAGDFTDNEYTNLRALCFLYTTYVQFFVKPDSQIESFADIAGHKFAVGAPGGGDVYVIEKLLKPYGMDFDDFQPEYVGGSGAHELMRDGHIDGAPAFTTIPHPTYAELCAAGKSRLIGLEPDIIEQLTSGDKAEFFPVTIPAGSYKGQEEDVHTVATPTVLCVDADISDEEVYQLTKAIWENIDELRSRHASLSEMDLEDTLNIKGIPLHPGAEKYYKEAGVIN